MLPKLAPLLPLSIPIPLAVGKAEEQYPWKWSIYQWIEGESAGTTHISNLGEFAKTLGDFLSALQSIDSTGGPLPGLHSFYRGGSSETYDSQTREAILVLREKIDRNTVIEIWEKALMTKWKTSPVWVHGDSSLGNLLVKNGQLIAVIDFGQLAIGDPACDLMVTWALFKDESRDVFRKTLCLDVDTWARGRA
jgi:aminoglycoside phosphotransferase (APT) family kinase protein